MIAARSPTTRTVMLYFRIIETGVVARLLSSNLKRGRPALSSSNGRIFYESGERFRRIARLHSNFVVAPGFGCVMPNGKVRVGNVATGTSHRRHHAGVNLRVNANGTLKFCVLRVA
jgi:hypothetical protein